MSNDHLRTTPTDVLKQLNREQALKVAWELAGLAIDTVPIVVFDTETTGLDPFSSGERVIEIALSRTDPSGEVSKFATVVNPGKRIPNEITAITGITEDEVRNAPLFADIAGEVAKFLSGAVVVAHNAPFDLGFLVAEFHRLEHDLPVQPVVDSVLLARRKFDFKGNNGKTDNRLANVARSLGITPRSDAHRAFADVDMTEKIFRAMIAHFQSSSSDPLTTLLLHEFMGNKLLTISPLLEGKEVIIPTPREDLRLRFAQALLANVVISFEYQKGRAKTVEVRQIKPTEVRDDRVIGIDIVKGEQREFIFGRIVKILGS